VLAESLAQFRGPQEAADVVSAKRRAPVGRYWLAHG